MKIWYMIIFSWLSATTYGQLQQGAKFTATGSGSAALKGPWSVNANPAGLNNISGPCISANYSSSYLLRSLATHALVIAMPLSHYQLGGSLQRYGVPGYHETAAGIALAKDLDKLSLGMAFHFYNISVEGFGSTSAFSITTGLQYKLTAQLDLGGYLTLKQGPAGGNTPKKHPVFVGFSYHPGEKVSVSYTYNTDSAIPNNCIGIEYRLAKGFHLGYGVNLLPFSQSFGFSLNLAAFTLNTAFVLTSGIGVSPKIEVGYAF